MKEKKEKTKKKINIKNRKGITLIALVITIIVLLILAGVSIAMLTGQNGILTQAQRAKSETENAAKNEAVILDEYNKYLNNAVGGGIVEGGTKPETDDQGYFSKTSTINGESPSANNPTIPAGYKPVTVGEAKWPEIGTAPEVTSVNEGLVIQDKAGNQFVWIPVETPVSDTEANGTTNKAMALKVGENYRGLLYDFTDNGSTVKSGCTTTTSGYSEPTLVSSDSSNGVTDLQSEYNKMITSVSKYYGFYIGRYELGLDGSNNPTSKKAENGIITADASNSETESWYGLYTKCKEYAPEEETKSVVSSMTWGSQYDAMMNWMQKNGINVNAEGNRNTNTTTGTSETDILKNIYDLYGCHREWTSEANSINNRVSRRCLFSLQSFASE